MSIPAIGYSDTQTAISATRQASDPSGFEMDGGDLVLSVMGHYGASQPRVDNALGIEAGLRHQISDQWSFVPQGQLTYSNADFDTFTDTDKVVTSVLDGESLEGRIGVALEGRSDVSFGYFRLNLIEEFKGKNKVNASGTTFGADVSGTSAEMSAGGSFEVSPGVRLYTDITARTGFSKELASFRGTTGVKVNW